MYKNRLGALSIEIANGLNNLGQIVGSSNVPPPAPHVMESTAAQLYQDGTVTNLVSLGGYISAANGINDRGEIVGYSDTGPDTTSPLQAFLYRDGKMTDLGTFGGQNSDATAINPHGVIAGAADLPPTSTTTPEHAFIYRSGRMIDLGVVGSDVSSSSSAINDFDEVVHQHRNQHHLGHPFLDASIFRLIRRDRPHSRELARSN